MVVVVDVGAYIGHTLIQILRQIGVNDFNAYAFEPSRSAYPIINDPRIKVLRKAVSTENCIKTYYECKNKVSSSLLPFITENKEKWVGAGDAFDAFAEYDVECVRLDTFMDEENLTEIDVLKVDAQGHDLDVIKSLGDKLKNVKQIIAEVSITDFDLYENGCKKDEMFEFMETNNFSVFRSELQTHDQELNVYFRNNNFSEFFDVRV
tara:strand:+ start:1540 stop:2160 length:621 start_codon:yes stop_codon:yes gene_type:complete